MLWVQYVLKEPLNTGMAAAPNSGDRD